MLRVHPDVAKVLKSNQNQVSGGAGGNSAAAGAGEGDPLLHHEKFDLA